MTPTHHARTLAYLAILAFVGVLAQGLIIWLLRAVVTLAIAGVILALFFGGALLLGWMVNK